MKNKNEMAWEEFVNQKARKEHGLQRTYRDTSLGITHIFRVHSVKPFAYTTLPITLDYKLFVDVEKITDETKETRKEEILREIYLGSTFSKDPRKLIPFGEKYFEDTSKDLTRIVVDGWKDRERK